MHPNSEWFEREGNLLGAVGDLALKGTDKVPRYASQYALMDMAATYIARADWYDDFDFLDSIQRGFDAKSEQVREAALEHLLRVANDIFGMVETDCDPEAPESAPPKVVVQVPHVDGGCCYVDQTNRCVPSHTTCTPRRPPLTVVHIHRPVTPQVVPDHHLR